MATDTGQPDIRVGGLYRHFKGMLYTVTAIARHSETDGLLVIYRQLYPPYDTWARPVSMFLEPVDKTKYPDCAQTMRFELLAGRDAP